MFMYQVTRRQLLGLRSKPWLKSEAFICLRAQRAYATNLQPAQQQDFTDTVSIEEKLQTDCVNAPSTFPPPLNLPMKTEGGSQLRYLMSLAKAYLRFYKTGTKRILANRKVAARIKKKFAGDRLLQPIAGPPTQYLGEKSEAQLTGDQLSRAEYQLVLRSAVDAKKLPIFGLLFLIFGEWLPLLVFFLAPVLPGTVLLPKQILKRRQRSESFSKQPSQSETGIVERSALQLQCRRHGLAGPLSVLLPSSFLKARYIRHTAYLEQDSTLLKKDADDMSQLDDLELDRALEERALWRQQQTREQKEQSLSAWLESQTHVAFQPDYMSKAKDMLAIARADFAVDGKTLPDVDFDVGPSFAGLMPISSDVHESRKLFFWFFPGQDTESLTIFLNGGPGCSSLEGAIQENGPIIYRKGMLKPERNPYAWTRHTSMLYVEQPVGTGFSTGEPDAQDEMTVGQEFYGFLEQFQATFNETKKKSLYITGESYAGKYVPYVSKVILDRGNRLNLKGIMLVDPSVASMHILQNMPAAAFMQRNQAVLGLDDGTVQQIQQTADDCGFTKLLKAELPGPITIKPSDAQSLHLNKSRVCLHAWERLQGECMKKNPNFNIYKVTDSSLPYDPLGFPASAEYLPPGGRIYFARPDVQKAIHAPPSNWTTCSRSPVFPDGDASPDVIHHVLGEVIEKLGNVMVVHGLLDMVLIEEGVRLALQTMRFNNATGFKTGTMKTFGVEGRGQTGHFVQERGLSYVQLKLSGHQVPEDAGDSSLRLLRILLGKETFND